MLSLGASIRVTDLSGLCGRYLPQMIATLTSMLLHISVLIRDMLVGMIKINLTHDMTVAL